MGALAPQLLTDDWVPVLVDAFKTALEASLAGDGDDVKKVAAVADAAQDAGESLDVEGEPEHEDALPCAIVPLKVRKPCAYMRVCSPTDWRTRGRPCLSIFVSCATCFCRWQRPPAAEA